MLSAVCVAQLGAFVVAMALAVQAYPGGSWEDARADGFAFWTNYWCDLMSSTAWNGADNGRSAVLAKAAFLTLAGSMACFWLQASRLSGATPAARRIRRFGLASSLAVVVMVAAPYPTYRVLHAVSTLVAGGCASVATVLVVTAAFRDPTPALARRLFGGLFLVAAVANVLVYSRLVIQGGGNSVALPIIQKLGTLILPLWVLATLLAVRSRAIDSAAIPGQTGAEQGGSP
jgi:hypothetical protein